MGFHLLMLYTHKLNTLGGSIVAQSQCRIAVPTTLGNPCRSSESSFSRPSNYSVPASESWMSLAMACPAVLQNESFQSLDGLRIRLSY